VVVITPFETPRLIQDVSPLAAKRMWLSTLFLITVVLTLAFLQGNRFPAMWHPDEPRKVHDILTGENYFNHPLLLLRSTKLVLALTGPHPNPEEVAIAGRQVSAISAALSVLMLALAAARLNGYLASLLVAVLVGSCPLLFGLAHYMKEDCILLFGLCLFFFTAVLFDERANTLRLLGMSISAGLAASTKYIGIITVPIALGLVLWKWRHERTLAPIGFVVCFCAALITFFTIGVPITAFSGLRSGVSYEIMHVTTSHFNFVWAASSPIYLVNLVKLSSPIIIVSYILWLFILYGNRGRVSAAQTIIALFPIVFLVLLQIASVKIIRYELPTVMLIGFGAACALANLATSANSRIGLFALLAVAGALTINLAGIYRSWQAIVHDTRAEMAHWIEEHLAKDAVIAQEGWPAIEQGQHSTNPDLGLVSPRVVERGLPSYGSLDAARQAGVTHILLQQAVFGCYVDPGASVLDDPQARSWVAEARQFYGTLIRGAPVVHYVDGRNPPGTFFSPTLWLFCIICEPASVPHRQINFAVPCLF
jgi:MFS family permease